MSGSVFSRTVGADMGQEARDHELRFDGQVVLVTGAGRGLGAAYARLFAVLGATVIVHDAGVDRDGHGGDHTVAEAVAAEIRADGGSASTATSDLLAPGAAAELIEDAVGEHGRIDVVVHNAGVVLWEEHDHPSDAIWRTTMGVNVEAGFHLVRAALRHMRTQNYGRIVLTTSGRCTTIADAAPGLVAYATAKMAMVGMMNGFAADLTSADSGDTVNIRINAISPVAATRVLVRDAPELTPESVAPGVAYLASSAIDRSGIVLAAAGGRFGLEGWSAEDTHDLGAAPTIADLHSIWPVL